jgi:hypothetical protein
MKLWLAGMHSVRVVTMGGGMVLLFCDSGKDVGDPARDVWHSVTCLGDCYVPYAC